MFCSAKFAAALVHRNFFAGSFRRNLENLKDGIAGRVFGRRQISSERFGIAVVSTKGFYKGACMKLATGDDRYNTEICLPEPLCQPLYKIPKGERTVKSATRNGGNVLFTEVCRYKRPALFLPNRSQKFRNTQGCDSIRCFGQRQIFVNDRRVCGVGVQIITTKCT